MPEAERFSEVFFRPHNFLASSHYLLLAVVLKKQTSRVWSIDFFINE